MQFQDLITVDLNGGINTADLSTSIRDNELADILNMEYRYKGVLSKRQGTTRLSEDSFLGSDPRITSIFEFFKNDGTQHVICTHGNQIRKRVGTSFPTAASDITGATTLPDNTYWQWIAFGNKAIGVNGGTALFTNPVQYTGTGDAAALSTSSGTPNPGKYIASCNGRVWLAGDSTQVNVLQWSAFNDSAVWAAGSLATDPGFQEIGSGDGDIIIGLLSHKSRLFILKRRHIYEVVFGSPNTDQTLFDFQLVTSRQGSVSGYGTQVTQDVPIIVSPNGVVPLPAVQQFGDFSLEQSLSKNILELREHLETSVDTYASAVLPGSNQYFLSVPVDTATPAVNNTCYVMDFKQGVTSDAVRWTRYDGKMAAACYGIITEAGKPRLYVGGYDGIYRYGDADVFSDDYDSVISAAVPAVYDAHILTKDYNLGISLKRKLFNYFGARFKLHTGELHIGVTYKFDGKVSRSKGRSFFFETGTPSLYGTAIFDVSRFSDEGGDEVDFIQRFSGSPGRKAQTVQFLFSNTVIDEGFTLKEFGMDGRLLSRRFVSDTHEAP